MLCAPSKFRVTDSLCVCSQLSHRLLSNWNMVMQIARSKCDSYRKLTQICKFARKSFGNSNSQELCDKNGSICAVHLILRWPVAFWPVVHSLFSSHVQQSLSRLFVIQLFDGRNFKVPAIEFVIYSARNRNLKSNY